MKFLIIVIISGLSITQGHRRKQWKAKESKCQDQLACDIEYNRYCPGDPSGRQCGSPGDNSFYYRSVSGCKDPKKCEIWNNINETQCDETGQQSS